MIGICLFVFIILIIWSISSSVIITRIEFVYNADDYDRSINEAIKITKYASHSFLDNPYSEGIYYNVIISLTFLYRKRENSAEPVATTANRRVLPPRSEAPSNGKLNNGPSPTTNDSSDGNSSKSDDYRDSDGEQENEALDRRYS
jgi:hypothetical protein